MTDAIAELLARYHLGLLPDREGARLAAILEENPADALERLARACAHLGVTGEHAERLAQTAADYGPQPARDYRAASAANTRTHEPADGPTLERPNTPTRGDTSRNRRTGGTP